MTAAHTDEAGAQPPAQAQPFRGWQIVGAAAAIQFMQAGLLLQAFGAYVAVLSQEMGWSRSALSAAAALKATEAAVLGPVLGWIIDRHGPQWVIRLGILLFGVGFMFLSTIDTLPGFFAAIFVIALGSSMCGFFPLQVSVIHWFEHKRARALSTVGLGLALGGVFVPVVAWVMQAHGWRTAAFASGVLVIVVGSPLARVFRHRAPLDADMAHGQAGDEAAHPGTQAASGRAGYTARAALRTRAFWMLAAGHGAALLVVTGVNVHAINHMSEGLGYTIPQASLVIMLVTVSQVAGVLLGGLVGDRYDKRLLAAGCMLMHAAGMFCLTFATSTAALVVFAVLHGVAWGLRGPLMQAIRADYFGRKAIGLILGLSSMIIVVGQIAGPLLAGVLADLTGDYRVGFVVLASLAALGSVMFLLARPPQRI